MIFKCPHCEYVYNKYYEADPLKKDEIETKECENCGEMFELAVHISYNYITKKKCKLKYKKKFFK